MTEEQAKATIAVSLLEHAAKLLAAASNEGPKGEHAIGPSVANINRQIHRLQHGLIAVIDCPSQGERDE